MNGTTETNDSDNARVRFRLVYDEGARARASGQTHLDNPYPVGTFEREAWLRGWGSQPDTRLRSP